MGNPCSSADELSREVDGKASNRVKILPQCLEVKPWFPTRPSIELVRELLHFIRDGGEPHEWRGHTHTRPIKGGTLVYLEEFDLPLARFKAKDWAVCPCCAPETRRYGSGKIGWFPDEAVIRLLGPKCFRSLDKGAHDTAYGLLKAEKRARQDEEFVLSKLPLLHGVLDACRRAIPVAEALDEFRNDLVKGLKAKRIMLWEHVRRDGKLKYLLQTTELRVGRDGNESIVNIELERPYADLPGYELLDPMSKPVAPKLMKAERSLVALVPVGDWRGQVAGMDALERRRLVQSLNSNVNAVRDCVAKLKSQRQLGVQLTVNTLRAWGKREGCPIPSRWEHEGSRITFGTDDLSVSSVRIPAAMFRELYAVQF